MNTDLGKTRISDALRVSSAIIHYDHGMGYYQYETWVFNYQGMNRQFIWGTSLGCESKLLNRITTTAHRRISKVMILTGKEL